MKTEVAKRVLEFQQDIDLALGYHDALCGEFLGSGISRTVYQHAIDPSLVVKIQHDAGCHDNILEFEIWQDVKWTDYKVWFAPCKLISDNGRILIQKKVKPLNPKP